MPVAGDIAAVIEIIEHAKLFRQGMLVRSDFCSVQGDGWVAVADPEIPEDLVERAVFLNDVNHVANLVFTGSKRNTIGISAGGVSIRCLFRVSGQIRCKVLQGQTRK